MSVDPLARKVGGKEWGLVSGDAWERAGQTNPSTQLVLELRGLLCKELLSLVTSVCLPRHGGGGKKGERQKARG